jgi:hypothetical protein
VERHEHVVLQQRVGPPPVGEPGRRVEAPERVGRRQQQEEEERGDAEQHQQGPPDERVGQPVAEPPDDGHDEAGQHQRPQQDRALERRPQRREVEQRRRAVRAHVGDVGDREVAGDERPLHGPERHDRAQQAQQRVGPADEQQVRLALAQGDGQRDHAAERGGQAEDDPGGTDGGVHRQASPRSSASRTRSS